LLLVPKPSIPKKRNSEIYSDLSEDIPFSDYPEDISQNDIPPSFKYNI
jgi:hypothetical protein